MAVGLKLPPQICTMSIQEKINSGQATIVDVRAPGEFMSGHVDGAVNIPLNEVTSRLDEFKKMDTVVLCCASGYRSGQATDYLKGKGVDAYNGGGWAIVEAMKM